MSTFLTQPYPVREPRISRALWQSVFSGFVIAFILIVFQPFGTYTWQHPYKELILSGYGLIAAVTNFSSFFLLQKTFSRLFKEEHWQVWMEMLWNLLPCILGGFLSVVYGYLAGLMPFTLTQVGYMITICLLTGVFPATVLVLVNYTYLQQRYQVPAVLPEKAPPAEQPGIHLLELLAENGKDRVTIPAHDLLFISASDNYCTVFYLHENKLVKTLLRSSLSRLESQLQLAHVVRCHRSYLINLHQVQAVSGNAQGYKLSFAQVAEPVPVSRAFSSVVKELLVA